MTAAAVTFSSLTCERAFFFSFQRNESSVVEKLKEFGDPEEIGDTQEIRDAVEIRNTEAQPGMWVVRWGQGHIDVHQDIMFL